MASKIELSSKDICKESNYWSGWSLFVDGILIKAKLAFSGSSYTDMQLFGLNGFLCIQI